MDIPDERDRTSADREGHYAETEDAPRAPADDVPGIPADPESMRGQEERFRALFADGPAPQAFADATGRIAAANTAYLRLLGVTHSDLVGRSLLDLTHPADRALNARLLDDLVAGRIGSFQIAKRYVHADGHAVPVLNTVALVEAAGQRYVAAVALQRPLPAVAGEDGPCLHEALWRSRFHDSPLPQAHVDANGVFADVNDALCELLDLTAEQIVGRTPAELTHRCDPGDAERALGRLLSGQQQSMTVQRVFRHASGRPVPVVAFVNAVFVGGLPMGATAYFEDLRSAHDAERRLEQQARLEQQRNRAIVDALQEGIWATDVEGNTLFANSKMASILGVPLTTVYRVPADDLLGGDGTVASRRRARVLRGAERYELTYRHPDGGTRHLQVQAVPFAYGDPPVPGSLASVTDVTAQRVVEQELRQAALHDPLTRLPNRALLMDRIERALQRNPDRVGVLLVDIDQFKLVNDARGHDVGDQVLVELAARLQRVVHAEDTLARLGGDEFVVVCEGERAASTTDLATAIQREVRRPVAVDGHDVRLTASIGVAGAPAASASDLLRFADAAMFAAKATGRARARVFDRALADQAEHAYRLAADLQAALHDDVLTGHYQPIVDLASGAVTGYEMLARWVHPDQGPVRPDVFVPLAERTGLTRALDDWAIRRGVEDAAALRARGAISTDTYVAVNLSAQHLGDADLEDRVVAATARAGVPARRLCFEITEGAIMHDVAAALRLLGRLRDRGYQIALDDFGTGHSSLAYLRDLPITALKIDRSFITEITASEDARAIVTSIIQLARAVGAATVAEGVETVEQAVELRLRGCTSGQGWLWSQAVAPDELGGVPRRFPAPSGRGGRRSGATREPPLTDEHGLMRMFELQREGASLTTIAAALNAEGYRTPRGSRWHRLSVARAIADLRPASGDEPS